MGAESMSTHQGTEMKELDKLVELPKTHRLYMYGADFIEVYTSTQLRTYGQACYEAGKQSAAGDRVDNEVVGYQWRVLIGNGPREWTDCRKKDYEKLERMKSEPGVFITFETRRLTVLIDSQKSGEGECSAIHTGHKFGPHGPGGSRQCEYCGEPDSAAHDGAAEEREDLCRSLDLMAEGRDRQGMNSDAACIRAASALIRSFTTGTTPTADANKPGQVDVGARARELLAAEYERAGAVHTANDIRQDMLLHDWPQCALRAITAALSSPRADVGDAPSNETSNEGPCTEADGCPTERAVLQRQWRANQLRLNDLELLREDVDAYHKSMDAHGFIPRTCDHGRELSLYGRAMLAMVKYGSIQREKTIEDVMTALNTVSTSAPDPRHLIAATAPDESGKDGGGG
jgi:hypothetical protein